MQKFGESLRTYFFIEETGIDDGPIKIGIATDVHRRLRTLQTGNLRRFIIWATMEGNHEKEIHKLFRHLRITGEWFSQSPELTAWIHVNAQRYKGRPKYQRRRMLKDMRHREARESIGQNESAPSV